MKNAKRIIAICLCVMLVASAFYGCTYTINVNIEGDGSSVAAPVADNAQPAAPVETPQTEAPVAAAPATPDSTAAPTNAPAAAPKADAPAANKTPSTKEEILAAYNKAYNTTKPKGTLTGNDAISCESVLYQGKENSMLKNAAGSFMKSSGENMQLPPYTDSDPCNKSLLTASDIKDASYKDNGDGTATIHLEVVPVKGSKRLKDSAGKMFNVMEADSMVETLKGISIISWAEGDALSNVTMTSQGSCDVTYNTSTNIISKAEYDLITVCDVTHVNVMILNDKSVQATFKYVSYYPSQAK